MGKLRDEVPLKLPALPEESPEKASGADFTRCSGKHDPDQDGRPGESSNVQAMSCAMSKSPATTGKASPLGNTSDNLITTGLDVIEELCRVYPPDSSIFLINDGVAGEAYNGAGESSMPGDSSNMLIYGAALEDWLDADVSEADQCSPSDIQFLASVLNLEEW